MDNSVLLMREPFDPEMPQRVPHLSSLQKSEENLPCFDRNYALQMSQSNKKGYYATAMLKFCHSDI